MSTEVLKIATTGNDGDLRLMLGLYTALRRNPFATDEILGSEIKPGNYAFEITQNDYYKLWVGPTAGSTQEFISFGGTGEGRYIVAEEGFAGATANLQNQIYSLSGSLPSYTLTAVFVGATSNLQNQINALSSSTGSFVFSNLDGGFSNTIYGGTTSFDAGGAI